MYFVIQVETGKENKVIQEMNERISDAFPYEAFTPKRELSKKIKDKIVKVLRPYFPGYIFVETEDGKELYRQLLYVPSFTKLLGKSSIADEFIPLNPEEERTLDILCNKHMERVTRLSQVAVKEGMKIQILDGPLIGYEGIIKKVNLHKRTVVIPISIGGRPGEIELGIDIVSESLNQDN